MTDPRASAAPVLLDVDRLTVTYRSARGRVTALHDVCLQVRPGERVAVVGESGSGKTTLGMAIGGFLRAGVTEISAARFDLDGQDLRSPSRTRIPVRRAKVSMVFQDAMTSLDPVWSVGSQLLEVVKANTHQSRRAAMGVVQEWLDRVGLPASSQVLNKRPYELSGGMRQRVMLVLALCSSPQLLIADEPTSALDATLAREVMELMHTLVKDTGASLLIISHDIELCTDYTDRTVVMYGGHVVEVNRSDVIVEQAVHPYTVALTRCIPTLATMDLDALPSIAPIDPALARIAPDDSLQPVSAGTADHLVNAWNPGFADGGEFVA